MRTLFVNGRVCSLVAGDASGLLVDGGRISWLGDSDPPPAVTADRVVDLDGALVVPAFVDAHFHATGTGLSLAGLELSGTPDLGSALARLESLARRTAGRPIIGSGWDETAWPERRAPSRGELDRASYGGVVYLARVDGHSAVVSSALAAAIDGFSALEGFAASGPVTGQAHHAARAAALSTLSAGSRRDLQRAALVNAAAQGVAAVHEMAGPEVSSADDLLTLLELSRSEPLPEVVGYWGALGEITQARELGAAGAGGDIFCDGSLGSHTAALTAPYADLPAGDVDRPDTGDLRFELGDLVEHIVRCTEAGLQAGFHAIGDAAVDQVVEAMLRAASRLGAGRVRAAGHRIEHVELIPSIPRLAASGLLASVQPAFDATWGGPTGMYAQRLGAERAAQLNPFGPLVMAGVPLAFGSDAPVTPVDPWRAVWAATHPSNPTHAVSRRDALAAHTRGGWRAARSDGDGSGELRVGRPATLAIFEVPGASADTPEDRRSLAGSADRALPRDVTAGAAQPDSPRCLLTMSRGRVLFDSGDLS